MANDPRKNSQEDAFALPPAGRARFFFDTLNGETTILDSDGRELDSIEAARAEAVKALRDMARDSLPDSDQGTVVVRVRDETGETVLMAALTLSVQRMR